jgi:hypothetical protein
MSLVDNQKGWHIIIIIVNRTAKKGESRNLNIGWMVLYMNEFEDYLDVNVIRPVERSRPEDVT